MATQDINPAIVLNDEVRNFLSNPELKQAFYETGNFLKIKENQELARELHDVMSKYGNAVSGILAGFQEASKAFANDAVKSQKIAEDTIKELAEQLKGWKAQGAEVMSKISGGSEQAKAFRSSVQKIVDNLENIAEKGGDAARNKLNSLLQAESRLLKTGKWLGGFAAFFSLVDMGTALCSEDYDGLGKSSTALLFGSAMSLVLEAGGGATAILKPLQNPQKSSKLP